MSGAAIPAAPLVGEVSVDLRLVAISGWHGRNYFQNVWGTWRCVAHGAYENFDIPLEIIDRLI
jgi:hypothetical protein